MWAAAILAVSITLRSLDFALCDRILIDGRKVGTHFAWHILNGLALFLLLRASLEGAPDRVRAPRRSARSGGDRRGRGSAPNRRKRAS